MGNSVGNNKQKTRVIWFTNIPSPYRVDFFEELGKNIDLFVVFEKKRSDERDKSWECTKISSFRAVFLNGYTVRTDSAFDFKVLQYLHKCNEYDYVVFSNPLTPLGIFCILFCRTYCIPFYIETDGGFPKNGKGARERLKKICISGAQGCFSTARIHDEYYLQYGAKSQKIIRYPFTSVHEYDLLQEPIDECKKEDLRSKLGITQRKMVLGVGQFIRRKGFDVLLEIGADLDEDTAIVLLGGDETSEYEEIIKRHNLKNVFFPGFISKDRIAEYYQAADVFVLPTREDIWGLVINEAIAYALPVVTTTRCIAGTELVRQGVNGYLIEPDDREGLKKAVQNILDDKRLRERMAHESLKTARNYTIENMVKVHELVFIS